MFPQGAKSVILKPSFGMSMKGAGVYEISGLAWSGAGRISKVEVSADGGKTWALAALNAPVLPKALTRFRLPWHWEGHAVHTLLSRATDETGDMQPKRARVGSRSMRRARDITSTEFRAWGVEADGTVKNVYV